MIKVIIPFLFLLISGNTIGQDQFCKLLPGWSTTNVFEKDSLYYSINRGMEGYAQNHFQFATLSLEGEIIEEWEFDIDTLFNLVSFHTNNLSDVNNSHFISATIQDTTFKAFGAFIKYNADFSDTLYFKVYDLYPGNGTMFFCHTKINDNKFIIGGRFRNVQDIMYSSLIEVDSLGEINWRRNFFCWDDCWISPYQILLSSDGGYFFVCHEIQLPVPSIQHVKTVIIKTDSIGIEQYRLHPGPEEYFAVPGWMIPTDDGNYLYAFSETDTITSYLPQYNPSQSIWIHKINLEGDSIFHINLFDQLPLYDGLYPYNYTIKQMIKADNGDIIIIGSILYYKAFILNITQNGLINWVRLYDAPFEGSMFNESETSFNSISKTSDVGYIIGGEFLGYSIPQYPQGLQSAFILKLDEYGCFEPGCHLADVLQEISVDKYDVKIFPNPVSKELTIIPELTQLKYTLKVININGQQVLFSPSQIETTIVDVSNLTPGIYLLQLDFENGERAIKKFVKE